MPEGGMGRSPGVEGVGARGFRRVVRACTLDCVSLYHKMGEIYSAVSMCEIGIASGVRTCERYQRG